VRRGIRIGVIGAVCAGIFGAGGFGAYRLVHAIDMGGGTTTPQGQQQDPQHLVKAFLDSWAAGHYQGAASDTDNPSEAANALQAYHDGLHLTSVAFSDVHPGSQTDQVAFHVTAQLSGYGAWSYDSSAAVVEQNSISAVHWSPTVLHPSLTDGQQLTVGPLPASTAQVTDADGKPLNGTTYPSLTTVLGDLLSRNSGKVQGTPGNGVEITDGSGTYVSTVHAFTTGKAATLRSTLDARLQAAAEQAVHDSHLHGLNASVVAIDPATGWIRALAFTGGSDSALLGSAAPGSTMKIITAAALLDHGGLTPSSSAACTPTVEVDGQLFHNVDNEHATGTDLTSDFAMSCNTAFIRLVDNHLGFGDLKAEAQGVFGIGSWQIGVATQDGSVPDAAGNRNERAADAIGQGTVTMNPLAMASVTATVAAGTFRQPILLPGLPQTPAATPLSPSTASALRAMMRATASYGTAAPRMTGITGGAKTGTAETSGGTNGWFAAYDGHIAVAALVEGGSTGVDSAGYVVRDLLLTE
jgi:hypothetical protein